MVTLFGKNTFAVVIKLRISSLQSPWIAAKSSASVLTREGQREKADTEEKARRSKRQRCGSHGNPGNHRKLEDPGMDSPLEPPKGVKPYHWFWTPGLWNV